jgi:hypothetical protein
MSKRKGTRKLLEYEVKLYFQMLTSEAQRLNQELLVLSKPTILSMRDAINELENHYGDICNPAARGTPARLDNLKVISQALDFTLKDLKKVRVELNRLEKSTRKLKRRVTSKKTYDLAENLWHK